MSKAKFTSGPWIARGDTPSRIYGMARCDKEVIVAATGSVRNESGANAHLIAAAPKMYEMLEKLQVALGILPSEAYEAEAKELSQSVFELLAQARGDR